MVALFSLLSNWQRKATPGMTRGGFFMPGWWYHMSDIQTYVQKVLEEAPALTEEKRDKLTQLFGGADMP